MMTKHIMIAPLGGDTDALFVGIREFSTEKVILISDDLKKTEPIIKDLEKFKIPVLVKEMKGHAWEEMFRIVGEVVQTHDSNNVLMNVSTGDQMMSCAALSASFVNGIKAMAVDNSEVMILPVLKFSYYKMLTDRKMDLLKTIYNDAQCCASLEQLSKITEMSLPLVSYHVNGNLKSDGLKDLGLVETTENSGRTSITLTTLGRLLVKGYV